MPGKVPVDTVGGPQEEGPWPEKVDEIVEGETYSRPVEVYTAIECSEDGQTFNTMQDAIDHCDANHGGDHSLLDVETGVEQRDATVARIHRHGLREDPEEDGYSVVLHYDSDPGGV